MPASSTYDLGTMVTNPNIPQSVSHASMDDKTYTLALEISSIIQQQQQQQQHQPQNVDFMSVFSQLEDANNPLVTTLSEAERRRSQNMTECVAVPSSEHVAEIVGRQGCKIKALRAKTNTYIKTPVRGEEPVFVVTGRKEDVANAKREILSAADHFSQIRACRKNNINGSMAPGPPANVPGQKTIHVTVPYRVVGLVVGPKGATIKRIQQTTQTYIVTPSRDKEPIFEVTGLPDAVDAAKREIESHIAMRTGSMMDDETPVTPFDNLSNSADFYNALYNAGKPALNAASLNALLSSNSGYQQNMLANMNSHYSVFNGHSQPTASNGHASLTSGVSSNGLGGLGSNYSTIGSTVGSMIGSVLSSNASNTLADLPSFNGLGSSTSANNLLNSVSSHSYNGGNASATGHSAFGSTSSAFNFSLLGENANNIINSKNSGLNSGSSANLLSTLGNISNASTGNSTLQSMYGLDEGLGSLGSSMGSSPALDQAQFAQNIWSDAKYQLPPVSSTFAGRSFGCGSGSASRPLSPNRALNHGSVQRSNSDPTPKMDVLSSALNELSVSGLRCSNASSPDALPDYESTPFATVSGFSNSSPVDRSPVFELMSMGSGFPTTGSVLDSFSAAPTVAPVLAASAASAVPIGTPASPPVGGATSSPVQSNSASGSRRSSIDGALGVKICPSCKGESFEVAFVPCGHRRFCLPCAQKIQDSTGCCPSCHAESKEVIRIRDDHE